MLRTAYGFLFGALTLSTLPTSLIIQGGALAILGWTVWYLLARAIPLILKSHAEERAILLKEQEEARREFRESLLALTGSLNALTATLIKRK